MLSAPFINRMTTDVGLRYLLHIWIESNPAPWTHARCSFHVDMTNVRDIEWRVLEADDDDVKIEQALRLTAGGFKTEEMREFLGRLVRLWGDNSVNYGRLTFRFVKPRVGLDLFADNDPRFAEFLIDTQAEADAQRELLNIINSGGYNGR